VRNASSLYDRQLLQRTLRGVSLTHAGSSFLAHARVAGAEMRKAADEARRMVATERGLLSVGVSPVGGSLLLPELVNTLRRSHFDCRIRIMEMAPSAVLPLVRDALIDIGVAQRTRAGLDAGLRFRPLFELQMRIGVRPGHPLSGTRDLRGLAGASWLAMTVPGSSEELPDTLRFLSWSRKGSFLGQTARSIQNNALRVSKSCPKMAR
jgi:DNA-binding transcriptional LysR family regulator